MDFEHFKQRVNATFDQMSPQVQAAARYVLDNRDDVALMSMRQVAKEADVHPSTMVRLAQFLGFDGFNDIRDLFQNRLRMAPGDLVGRARDLQGQKGQTASLMLEIEETAHQNMRQTFNRIGAAALSDAADFILGAKRVYVMGMRISYPVAFSFYYSYSMFKNNAFLVDGRAGTAADVLRDIGKGDVLLAISNAPFSRETVQSTQYARKRGARVLAICDSEISPLAGEGDKSLVINNGSPTFFPSISAVVALVESLIAVLISKSGEEVIDLVAQSKAQLDEFDAYWEPQNLSNS